MIIKSFAAAWVVAAILAGVDAFWAHAVGIGIVGLSEMGDGLRAGVAIAIICGLIQYLAQQVGFRLIAEIFRRASRFFHFLSIVLVLETGFSTLSYLAIGARMPLIDDQLYRIDSILGFDWLAWFDFVESHRWMRLSLSYLYASTLLAIGATLVYLIVVDRIWRYHEMLWIFIITSALTITISGVLPAMHAPAYLRLADTRIILEHSYPYLPDLSSLREGTLFEIDLSHQQGLVCFPSFHTVLVMIFCYALRGTRLFWAALALGGLTMLSLPTSGGHYLIDLPGGAAVTAAAILLVRRWSPDRAALRIDEETRLAHRPKAAHGTIHEPLEQKYPIDVGWSGIVGTCSRKQINHGTPGV